METLNLPTYSFKLKSNTGRNYIFDEIRKKYVVLTPEEWVRQNFIKYLCEEKKFPESLISVETNFSLYNTKKRSDILIYDRGGSPVMMVECKAPSVKIDNMVFDQILRYNLNFNLGYLIITNGLLHFCFKIDKTDNSTEFLNEIPDYSSLIQ